MLGVTAWKEIKLQEKKNVQKKHTGNHKLNHVQLWVPFLYQSKFSTSFQKSSIANNESMKHKHVLIHIHS